LLCPTSHPELAYLRETPLTPTQYITDVQYMEKNEYGVETRKDGRPMPVEYLLDAKAVGQYIAEFSNNQFIELATNFHFLLFLLNNNIVKFSKEEVKSLCEIVQQQDRGKAMDWASSNENWATLSTICFHAVEG
uniref:Myosin motor domain-containing protein n=1 Tax=Gongylonema pulchrum TaxID=637853 RepID=A0A183ERR3_9BILA